MVLRFFYNSAAILQIPCLRQCTFSGVARQSGLYVRLAGIGSFEG